MTNEEAAAVLDQLSLMEMAYMTTDRTAACVAGAAALRRPCPEAMPSESAERHNPCPVCGVRILSDEAPDPVAAFREALVEVARESALEARSQFTLKIRPSDIAEYVVSDYLSTRAASHPATTEG